MDYNILEVQNEVEFRSRSNTWPRQRLENAVQHSEKKDSMRRDVQEAKKNISRRNAWGNFSYADLITQAITSSPDQRLTLSQIYEWMIQNVPYFKGRGDHSSSVGWKNSIRHNLSLHNKFLRLPNEAAGKSSWWMINPEAKPKLGRRRAATMETGKIDYRRFRAKKRADILRRTCSGIPVQNSSNWEAQGLPPSPLMAFHLSPVYRSRTYSCSSSCGLSPIPSEDMPVPPSWPGYSNQIAEENNCCEELANNLQYSMTVETQPVTFYSSYLDSIKLETISPPNFSDLSPSRGDTTLSNLNFQCFINERPSLTSSPAISQELTNKQRNGIAIEDISIDSFQAPFECNVDELINHELNIDGMLDFT